MKLNLISLFFISLFLNTVAYASEQVSFPGSKLKISGVLYHPQGKGPFPAVVALHGCGGLNQRDANWGEQLAKQGFIVLLPDSFGSRGLKSQCGVIKSPARTDIERVADAIAAKNYLETRADVRPEAISLLGWSNGGTTVLNAINKLSVGHHNFASAVAFYPYCRTLEKTGTYAPHAPLLLLMGAQDDEMPVSSCKTMVEQAKAMHKQAEIVIYAGAGHSFDTNKKPFVNPEAWSDALKRVPAFLAT
jgi:dienelactone hydrolase